MDTRGLTVKPTEGVHNAWARTSIPDACVSMDDESPALEKKLTLTSRQQIDLECDRFEAAWKRRRPRRIEDVLRAWQSDDEDAARLTLLWELVHIDLAYRWRVAADDSEPIYSDTSQRVKVDVPGGVEHIPERPNVEDYFARFPELHQLEAVQLDLIVAEYRARQHWGDRPEYSAYRGRFSHLGPELERSLRQVAFDLTPTILEIHDKQQLVFKTFFRVPLEIGRQRRGEPPPYCRIEETTIDRVIITPLGDNRISRSHVNLDTVAKGKLKLVNVSEKMGVLVNATDRLAPGDSRCLERPFSFHLGEKLIRLVEPSEIESTVEFEHKTMAHRFSMS